jgi:hypothetical protein
MNASLDVPDDFHEAARRALLALSSATLGGMAVPGVLAGDVGGVLLLAAAVLVAAATVPLHGARLRHAVLAIAAVAGTLAWLVVMPQFDREGIVVPALMAVGSAAIVGGRLSGRDDAPELGPAPPAADDGWIEEEGRRLPW